MGFENYISETEAAGLAGVAVSTLKRFAEAGYFRIETESDGLRLYSRSDLERVFGIQPTPAVKPRKTEVSTVSTKNLDEAPNPSFDQPLARAEVIETTPESSADTKSSTLPSQPETATEEKAGPSEDTSLRKEYLRQGDQRNEAFATLERDLHRQRLLAEMHDKLLAMREEEIRSLKEERDWLRSRVEKMEEKAQRDQVLLLSETQTIKTLLTIHENRRSPIRLALEWLGFIDPANQAISQNPRKAIDVTESAETNSMKKAA